ncbi:MAG: helix-turn-helix transcriptional regulator [Planctomycetota bacterium]
MPVRAVHHRDYQTVPHLLRGTREDAGLTQRQLAERLGKSQQTVHSSETGSRRVDIGEFCRWVEACGLTAAQGLELYLAQRPKK